MKKTGNHVLHTMTIVVVLSAFILIACCRYEDCFGEPFQHKLQFRVEQNEMAEAKFFTVPGGKRLVIKYVNGMVDFVTKDHKLRQLQIRTFFGGEHAIHYFLGVGPNIDYTYFFAQPVHLYAEPNTEVRFSVFKYGHEPADVIVNVSGFLIDAP